MSEPEEVTDGHDHDDQHLAGNREHSPVPDSDQGSPLNTYKSQLERLKAIEREYQMTIKVVAVLAEQLLNSSWAREPGLTQIIIDDQALLDCPELIAWRDEATQQTVLKIKR